MALTRAIIFTLLWKLKIRLPTARQKFLAEKMKICLNRQIQGQCHAKIFTRYEQVILRDGTFIIFGR